MALLSLPMVRWRGTSVDGWVTGAGGADDAPVVDSLSETLAGNPR